MKASKGVMDLSQQALPISEAKARFSELVRKAGTGLEVLSANKHDSTLLVSIVRTDILTAALDSLTFTICETVDAELGVTTVAVEEIPVYGEGQTREEAIQSLLDATLDYAEVYLERIELFSHTDSPKTQGLMIRLLRCREDRQAIRQTLGII